MGISKHQASQNREAIIVAAEKLFRERGIDGVGLVELMDAAGFTRGGFYNHFKSKDALVAAVMAKAMEDGAADLIAAISDSEVNGRDPLQSQIAWYLSAGHRADIASGCPLSGFAGDVRRLDDVVRLRYAQGLATNLERLATIVGRPDEDATATRQRSVAVLCEMVGALVLSRAVAEVAPDLSDEILECGRRHLRAISDA